MKKTAAFLTAFTLTFCALGMNAGAYELSARSAAVYEPVTGEFLYGKNADERMLVASTTKVMTALIVLENCGLDEKVEVLPEHTAVEGSSMYLKAGESYTVEQLLYGLLLASGNDAACALAAHVAGSTEAFADLMNAKCAQLSLENSHFENPHGLDGESHYSSAGDLAIITAEAMRFEDFCRIFSTRSYQMNGLTYVNHNKLLSTCEGCIGGKTGYTEAAGRVLVSCVEREGMRLICVTISDPRDWEDHRWLYDEMYSQYRFIPLPSDSWSSIPLVSGVGDRVKLKCARDGFVAPKDAAVEIRAELPRFVFAPAAEDGIAGRARVYVDGELTGTHDIMFSETVYQDGRERLTPWEQFKRGWYRAMSYGIYYPNYYYSMY